MSERVDMKRFRRRLADKGLVRHLDGFIMSEDGPAILELIEAASAWRNDMNSDELVDRLHDATTPFIKESDE